MAICCRRNATSFLKSWRDKVVLFVLLLLHAQRSSSVTFAIDLNPYLESKLLEYNTRAEEECVRENRKLPQTKQRPESSHVLCSLEQERTVKERKSYLHSLFSHGDQNEPFLPFFPHAARWRIMLKKAYVLSTQFDFLIDGQSITSNSGHVA